uniref:Sgnh hydrolase n=1 Tax=Tetraselmis sp. GSL018 TaxID=582737 RepID=A0A061RR79_9CHLO
MKIFCLLTIFLTVQGSSDSSISNCGDGLDYISVRGGSRRSSTSWDRRHEDNIRNARRAGSKVELAIYGDSITEDLAEFDDALDVYEDDFRTVALGIGGDRSENLLYRLQDGEWDSDFKLKFAAVLIGTNNVRRAPGMDRSDESSSEEDRSSGGGADQVAEEILSDVRQIVSYLHRRDCSVNIVLQAILPLAENVRNEWPNRYTDGVERTNELLRDFADRYSFVHFVDCGELFLEGSGGDQRIDRDLMSDLLHPTERGHKKMAECVVDRLKYIERRMRSSEEDSGRSEDSRSEASATRRCTSSEDEDCLHSPLPPPPFALWPTPPKLYPVYMAPPVGNTAELPRAFWPDWYTGPTRAPSPNLPDWWLQGSATNGGSAAPTAPSGGATNGRSSWWEGFTWNGGRRLLRSHVDGRGE